MEAWRVGLIGALVATLATGGRSFAAEHLMLAQLRLPSSIAPLSPPTCQVRHTPPSDLEPFRTLVLATGAAPVTHVRLVVAGRRLALALPAAEGRLSLSAKNANDGVFETICTGLRVGGPRGARVIEATAPARLSGSIWRIELELAANPRRVVQTLSIARTPGTGQDEDWAPLPEAMTQAEGFLCIGSRDWPERRLQSGFAGRIRLSVDTKDPERPLTDVQRRALSEIILRAVSLWVQGCGPCRADHLAVVEIDGVTYVRDALAEFYRDDVAGAALGDLAPETLEKALGEALEPQIRLAAGDPPTIPRSKMFAGYRPVVGSGLDSAVLCAVRTTNATPILSAVGQALCAPQTLPASRRASILLRFRDGATACGNRVEIIGCRADGELTEYNARDYRFAADDGRVIGEGPIELDLLHVILHEMGHWIGLGHNDAGESIMASSLRRSRCIDGTTMDLLAAGLQEQAPVSPAAFTLN